MAAASAPDREDDAYDVLIGEDGDISPSFRQVLHEVFQKYDVNKDGYYCTMPLNSVLIQLQSSGQRRAECLGYCDQWSAVL
jgi:hypothetical protein